MSKDMASLVSALSMYMAIYTSMALCQLGYVMYLDDLRFTKVRSLDDVACRTKLSPSLLSVDGRRSAKSTYLSALIFSFNFWWT